VLFRVEGRPGGLPRRVVRRADVVPRLVLAYRRVLFFVLFLRSWVLAVSVIIWDYSTNGPIILAGHLSEK
jgi:hypothetical protein